MKRTATTRGAPPSQKPPAKARWVCHMVRPLTGHPTDAKGAPVLCYDWTLEGVQEPAREIYADPVPGVKRGALAAEKHPTLFD